MIKRLIIFDLDGTIMNTVSPETGKPIWGKHYSKPFKFSGWWGRPESLDLNVFDIKPFPKLLEILNKEIGNSETYVVILTNRIEKLRPEVQTVLDVNNIRVDKLDMKSTEETKGERLFKYIQQFPDLIEINAYEDRQSDIESYENIKYQIPKNIRFNIYLALNGQITLLKENNLLNIIKEEIHNFVGEKDYVYHGTYDGAGYGIQRDGRMKINAAGNNEPYISFTSKPNTAKYYANMKGGTNRGIILRTKMTNDFRPSPKYKKNDGFEWITEKEIPITELEINTKYGWVPLNNWDFIDREIKK